MSDIERRIIKFRGKVLAQWDYVTPDDDRWEQFWSLVDRSTVGQLAMVKGDLEIYEDDIIGSSIARSKAVVAWKGCAFKLEGIGSKWNGYLDWFRENDLEVIGNIWDNPVEDRPLAIPIPEAEYIMREIDRMSAIDEQARRLGGTIERSPLTGEIIVRNDREEQSCD